MLTTIRKTKRQAGFTLIELLIVIVILGILAAVGIPKFMNNRVTAWAATCRANRATITDAAERLWNDTNEYPKTGANPNAGPLRAKPTNEPTKWAGWDGPYLKQDFECPSLNATNTYSFSDDSGTVKCGQLDKGVHPER